MDTEASIRALGQCLYELRKKKGVSQSYIDRYFDWPDKTMQRMERGNTQKFPPSERLRALANFFGVSLSDLMNAAGYGDTDTPQSEKPQIPTVDRRRRQPAESH